MCSNTILVVTFMDHQQTENHNYSETKAKKRSMRGMKSAFDDHR